MDKDERSSAGCCSLVRFSHRCQHGASNVICNFKGSITDLGVDMGENMGAWTE